MAVFINTTREGYTPEQCRETMTVNELIEALENYPEDTPVYFCNDNGYTYGSICESLITDEPNGDY